MVGDVRPMQDFVERFIDRVIEMAVGDIDQGISLESIELLRSLQL